MAESTGRPTTTQAETPATLLRNASVLSNGDAVPTELPERGSLTYDAADPETRARIDSLVEQIDLTDSQSVIAFGAHAQEQLRSVTGQMLEGVRNKDAGPAGEVLNEMVLTVRGFDLGDIKQPGFLARLFGAAKPVARMLQRYEEIAQQIHALRSQLDRHKDALLRDIVLLDRLYASSLAYFRELEVYIAAGEERLRRLEEEELPALRKEAENGDPIVAQNLQRLIAARNDLERKVHDLRLTRTVTMQSLPSIALVQDNDKSLVTKIDSTIVNTIPLWEVQIAQAVTIHRSGEAAKTIRNATDLTNELLEANAANLRQANAETRREIERGVFDIESVKKANADLIATIEESLKIAEEGRQSRAEAEKELAVAEQELREALIRAQ